MCGPACTQDPRIPHVHPPALSTYGNGFPRHNPPSSAQGYNAARAARMAGMKLPKGYTAFEWAYELQRRADWNRQMELQWRAPTAGTTVVRSPLPAPVSNHFTASVTAPTEAIAPTVVQEETPRRQKIYQYLPPVRTNYLKRSARRRKLRDPSLLFSVEEEDDVQETTKVEVRTELRIDSVIPAADTAHITKQMSGLDLETASIIDRPHRSSVPRWSDTRLHRTTHKEEGTELKEMTNRSTVRLVDDEDDNESVESDEVWYDAREKVRPLSACSKQYVQE